MRTKAENILFGVTAAVILSIIGLRLSNLFVIAQTLSGDLLYNKFFTGCLVAPVVEETLFRYVPMSLIRHRADFNKIKWPVIIGVSIVFGWMHGDEINVLFMQGLGSLCLFWVYIKNGYSLISSMIMHSIFNFIVYAHLINWA